MPVFDIPRSELWGDGVCVQERVLQVPHQEGQTYNRDCKESKLEEEDALNEMISRTAGFE